MTKPGRSYLDKLYVNDIRSSVRRQQEWLHTVAQYSAELPEQSQRYVANAVARLAKTSIATESVIRQRSVS